MPVHNYMIEDLSAVLKAIAFFPVFVLFPGYVAGWLLDLFDFRRRTLIFRVSLGIPLSISICPILTFLTARYCGLAAVWAFYAAAAILFFALAGIDLAKGRVPRPLFPAYTHVFGAIFGGWLAIAVLSLVDLQIGNRLYYPTSAIDYALRSGLVHSITATGVPPQNPFFEPGHPVLLRYHYFWLLICSLAQQATGGITARQALIAGTFWIGVALVALLAIYLRLFSSGPFNRPLHQRLLTGVALLAITGLDILPSLFFLWLHARDMVPFVQPGVELWNEHVDWFLGTVISTPHAIAAIIACFTAFLLLFHAAGARRYIVPAALAFASSVGYSVYVVFVFAAFLAIWTAIALWKRWYRDAAAVCIAGAASLALALPYLRGLSGSGAGGPIMRFTVRTFSLAALVRTDGLSSTWRLIVVNTPLLPLNYLLEFGLFFLVARHKWRQHRDSGRPASRQDLAMTVMAVTSTMICTFLNSNVIGNNDLGWRGFLVAQFALLLWAVDIFGERDTLAFLNPSQRQLLAVFFALGFAGTVTDLAMIRLYPVLADRGVVPPLDWMSPDRDFGHRTYAARSAYEWIQTATPSTAAVQANPHITFQDTLGMIYGDRRVVAADDIACLAAFGGDPKDCPPIVSRLHQLFPKDGRPAAASIREVCGALPIDVLVAKDTDSAWSDRESWVWKERPIYANQFVRAFACRRTSLEVDPLAFDHRRPVQHLRVD
jgi:hypothetical protein